MRSTSTTIIAGVAAAIVASAGVAVAIGDSGSDPNAEMVQTATTSATSTTAPPRPATSLALRAKVIGKVALLRQPATTDDVVPDVYAPSTDPNAPTSITKGDLMRARKLPGVASTWVVPLQTGALALVTTNGGAQFAPEQLDAGGVVQVTDRNGSVIVAGVVPDGTNDVSIETATGNSDQVTVTSNVYTKTFDATPATGRPTAVLRTSKTGDRTRFQLSGNTSDSK